LAPKDKERDLAIFKGLIEIVRRRSRFIVRADHEVLFSSIIGIPECILVDAVGEMPFVIIPQLAEFETKVLHQYLDRESSLTPQDATQSSGCHPDKVPDIANGMGLKQQHRSNYQKGAEQDAQCDETRFPPLTCGQDRIMHDVTPPRASQYCVEITRF
jgi:hypothetical protein